VLVGNVVGHFHICLETLVLGENTSSVEQQPKNVPIFEKTNYSVGWV
jgi:hypothetical protein